MIEKRNGFQERMILQEYNNQNNDGLCQLYIHKYDKQRLKSLLNEELRDTERKIKWIKIIDSL